MMSSTKVLTAILKVDFQPTVEKKKEYSMTWYIQHKYKSPVRFLLGNLLLNCTILTALSRKII
jgi:hypothetical protein